MEAVAPDKVGTEVYYIPDVPCPRCKVLALYHPEGTENTIQCVSCTFVTHIP